MFKAEDYRILSAAFIPLLFAVSLWIGVLGPANKEAGVFVDLCVAPILRTGLSVARRNDRG